MVTEGANGASRQRQYDIVVYGATGFTGKLIAEYLAKRSAANREPTIRWAIAGRSQGKLEAVRNDLCEIDGRLRDLPIEVADSLDDDALHALAARTRVITSAVGPFMKYGKGLVRACVDEGTHYCDTTGESPFVREMIDVYHDIARDKGVRIVHCCGYDSVPSDLGTLVVQDYAERELGRPCEQIKFFAGETKGGASGGTIASMLNIVEEATKNPKLRKVIGHPYALNPDDAKSGPDGSDQKGVRYDADLGRWTGPFVMAAINTRVVRRSNALMDFRYGRDFRYSEAQSFPPGPMGAAVASAFTLALSGFMAAALVPPARKLLADKVLPKPGEGPSKQKRESGYFKCRLVGLGKDKNGTPVRLMGVVAGVADPGYQETAKMVGESALCLALDDLDTPGGVLTPATAMGLALVERLRAAGMTFSAGPLNE